MWSCECSLPVLKSSADPVSVGARQRVGHARVLLRAVEAVQGRHGRGQHKPTQAQIIRHQISIQRGITVNRQYSSIKYNLKNILDEKKILIKIIID
jgi:ABC-type hemin transport system ATPase subunit